jgi:hypothetical protein
LILAGNSPGANVPAESVLALIEQGLQVYSAVHKRIYRANYKEFKKIRRLNALYMDQMTYQAVLDDPNAIIQADFANHDYDVEPVADPNNTTMMQRLMKAKAMLELRGQGLNDMEINRRYLLAMDVTDIDSLMPDESQEDPAEQFEMQKMQAELKELNAKVDKLMSETELNYAKIEKEYGGVRKTEAGIMNDERKLDIQEVQTAEQIAQGRRKADLEEQSVAKREYGLETNNQK